MGISFGVYIEIPWLVLVDGEYGSTHEHHRGFVFLIHNLVRMFGLFLAQDGIGSGRVMWDMN